MSFNSFLKKLIIFDVFWGRRSKIFHGIRDGGAKALEIGDSNKARISNGNTIFNVNDPDFECQGGHFHLLPDEKKTICLNFSSTDWVNNQIEIIYTGTPGPGQIGPHTLTLGCLNAEIYQLISSPLGTFKKVDVQIIINDSNRHIFLLKSPLPGVFSGRVLIDVK